MTVLTFTSEEDANNAEYRIRINFIRSADNVGDHTNHYTKEEISNKLDNEIDNLVVYGYRDGFLNKESGGSKKVVEIYKAYLLPLWWCYKPQESYLMDGVTNYSELPGPDSVWFEPVEV